MDKKTLTVKLNEYLKPLGFKKKGSKWQIESDDLIKLIELQKSQYGNFYYINYSYILKHVELIGMQSHVFNGLGSKIEKEKQHIKDLLNCENNIDDETRIKDLKEYINIYILNEFEKINTENDVLQLLKQRPHLNDIPYNLKEYFNLPIE